MDRSLLEKQGRDEGHTLVEAVEKALPKLKNNFVGRTVSPLSKTKEADEILGPMPQWARAAGLRDARGTLPWDSD